MRKNYDFTGARRNPYASRLATRVTVRVDPITLAYLEKLGGESETSRARIAALLLRECAALALRPAGVLPPRSKRKSETMSNRTKRPAR